MVGYEAFDQVAQKIMREAEQTARTAWDGMVPLEKVIRTGRTGARPGAGERGGPTWWCSATATGRCSAGSSPPPRATAVASRARCPVVCIPMVWQAAADHRHVVVGVEDPDHAYEVLSHAFVAASTRQARLRVLHTWKLQRPYDDVVVGEREADRWTASLTERLRTALRDLRSAYPEVVVDIDVRHQDPAAALLGATEGADLLVIGRRGHGAPIGLPWAPPRGR